VDHGRRNVRKISWITAVIHDFGASRRPRLAGERPAVPRRSSKSPDSPVGGGREPGNRGRDFNKSAPVHRPSFHSSHRSRRPAAGADRTDLDHHPPAAGELPQNGAGALVGVSVGVVEHHHSWMQHSPGRSATPWSGRPLGRLAPRRRRHNQRVKLHNTSWVTGAGQRTHRPSDIESAEPPAGRHWSRPPRSA
jgi:hypothetical protein